MLLVFQSSKLSPFFHLEDYYNNNKKQHKTETNDIQTTTTAKMTINMEMNSSETITEAKTKLDKWKWTTFKQLQQLKQHKTGNEQQQNKQTKKVMSKYTNNNSIQTFIHWSLIDWLIVPLYSAVLCFPADSLWSSRMYLSIKVFAFEFRKCNYIAHMNIHWGGIVCLNIHWGCIVCLNIHRGGIAHLNIHKRYSMSKYLWGGIACLNIHEEVYHVWISTKEV